MHLTIGYIWREKSADFFWKASNPQVSLILGPLLVHSIVSDLAVFASNSELMKQTYIGQRIETYGIWDHQYSSILN